MTALGSFDVAAWQVRCESIQAMAYAGCGLSYDLYQQRFSAAVEEHILGLPGEVKALAISVAVPFGYLTPAELAQVQTELVETGYCIHGIRPDCCPLGCGDIDHGEYEEPWQEPHPELDELTCYWKSSFASSVMSLSGSTGSWRMRWHRSRDELSLPSAIPKLIVGRRGKTYMSIHFFIRVESDGLRLGSTFCVLLCWLLGEVSVPHSRTS